MKLFVIHGWTYSLDAWGPLLLQLQAAGHDPRMLRVPGLTVRTDHPWTLDDYVSWLREQLEAEENPVVIGHSNGGRIALAYAARYPKHLKHLILLDSAGIAHTERSITVKRRVGARIAALLRPIIRGRVRRFLYQAIGAGDYGRAAPHMRQTMKHMLESDGTIALEDIQTSTTIIWGKQDTATPPSDARTLAKRLPNASRPKIIEDAGHSPHKTHPQETSRLILATLEKI